MNILLAMVRHAVVVGHKICKLPKRSILSTIVSTVKDVFRVIVVYLAVECSGCFCSHDVYLPLATVVVYVLWLASCASAALTSGRTSRPKMIISSSLGQPEMMNCVTPILLYSRKQFAIS